MGRSNPFAALAESESDSDSPATRRAPAVARSTSSSSSRSAPTPQATVPTLTFHIDGTDEDQTTALNEKRVVHNENNCDDVVAPVTLTESTLSQDEQDRISSRKRVRLEQSDSKDGVRWDVVVAVDKDVNVAAVGKVATVTYSGFLPSKNMKRFDAGEISWMVGSGGMITGFDIGVRGMREGERRRIYVPAKLGYGKKGHKPKIPPNADLVFDVLLRSAGIDWDSKQSSGMSKNRREEAKRRGKKPRRS